MKKLILITLATFICITALNRLTAQDYNVDLAQYYKEKGKEYSKEGKSIEALACFQSSILHYPDSYYAHMMAGVACHELSLYASMIRYFKTVVEIEPYDAFSHGNLGAIYAEMGYDEDAFVSLGKAMELDYEYGSACNNLGAMIMRYGNYDESIATLRKATEYNPSMPDGWFNIGVAYYKADRLDSAAYYYTKAIEVQPRYMKAYLAKAAVLHKMGRPKEEYIELCNTALEAYSKAIERNPDNYEARKMRADIYELLGEDVNMEEELKYKLNKLNKFVELYPRAYTFREARGNTHRDMGNTEAAIKDYKKVLEINPEYSYVRKKLDKLLNKAE